MNGITTTPANGLNQLTSVTTGTGSTALGYDGRGNLTSTAAGSYTYTSQNRLFQAPGGVELRGDGLDRFEYISTTTTLLAHDGPDIMTESSYTGSFGPILRRYVRGPAVDEPLVWYEGAGTADRRWLIADERGSVVAVTNSAGSAQAINSYDAFGVPASSNLGRFQFTGQAYVAETGLYDYKARVYDPRLGRFMQTDPIGYRDGMNLYAYVANDPVNGTDPSGLIERNAHVTYRGDPPSANGKFGDEIRVENTRLPPTSFASDLLVQDILRQITAPGSFNLGLDVQGSQNKNCPAPPTPGAGKSTIDQNIADARLDAKVNALDPFQDPFGAVGYANNLIQLSLAVTDASRQNYKKNPAFPGSAGYGSFNFGATMQARGFSLKEALGYSNAFQRVTTGRADPAEDVADVTNGYKYAAGGC